MKLSLFSWQLVLPWVSQICHVEYFTLFSLTDSSKVVDLGEESWNDGGGGGPVAVLTTAHSDVGLRTRQLNPHLH